jgi:hypothetical protein
LEADVNRVDLEGLKKMRDEAVGPPRLCFTSTHPVEYLLIYGIPALIAEVEALRGVMEALEAPYPVAYGVDQEGLYVDGGIFITPAWYARVKAALAAYTADFGQEGT